MKIRFKFRNKFHVHEISAEDAHVIDLLRVVSDLFKVALPNVQISLNAKDFMGLAESDVPISTVGIVNGDIVYVQSLELLDDIRHSMEHELFTSVDALCNRLSLANHNVLSLFALPVYLCANEKKLQCVDELADVVALTTTALRLRFVYASTPEIHITFTVYSIGNLICMADPIVRLKAKDILTSAVFFKDILTCRSLSLSRDILFLDIHLQYVCAPKSSFHHEGNKLRLSLRSTCISQSSEYPEFIRERPWVITSALRQRKLQGSPTGPTTNFIASRLLGRFGTRSTLGQPGSIPARVLLSGGMASRHRKGVTAERLPLMFPPLHKQRLGQPGSIPARVLLSGGMASRHRKGVTAERLPLMFPPLHKQRCVPAHSIEVIPTPSFLFKNLQLLSNRIKDELIEPVLVNIHAVRHRKGATAERRQYSWAFQRRLVSLTGRNLNCESSCSSINLLTCQSTALLSIQLVVFEVSHLTHKGTKILRAQFGKNRFVRCNLAACCPSSTRVRSINLPVCDTASKPAFRIMLARLRNNETTQSRFDKRSSSTRIFLYVPLFTLGKLMLCNSFLYQQIKSCAPVWRALLANLNAKKQPLLNAALTRQLRMQQQRQQPPVDSQAESNGEPTSEPNESNTQNDIAPIEVPSNVEDPSVDESPGHSTLSYESPSYRNPVRCTEAGFVRSLPPAGNFVVFSTCHFVFFSQIQRFVARYRSLLNQRRRDIHIANASITAYYRTSLINKQFVIHSLSREISALLQIPPPFRVISSRQTSTYAGVRKFGFSYKSMTIASIYGERDVPVNQMLCNTANSKLFRNGIIVVDQL
ncbi:hypothetical protein CLF_101148 [Clonorchis sinensis]|uniref:Uncharacterized protein n=1 Tax=Clonorchis sinensis TaxID=79923 RepID=G7Y548_CLOSI|nr:hypothetical protein CLF_101148 [Clonorchis sinensis]